MSTPAAECLNCRAALGTLDAFCRRCGEPAVTSVIDGRHAAAGRRLATTEDQNYRARLARALSADFEVRGQIGDGGFGVVYEAYDRRLGRSLAVKVLRQELADEGAARFLAEARIVASLRHPHIVPVHFLGEAEGLVFLTMPLLAGRTLRARIREGPLAPDAARRIVGEIAEALEAAHAAGVVHRDLKPENIFLEGDAERVVLMDFGIAKAASEAAQTLTGVVVGTPVYMSPEQFTGGGAADVRSDLYALGVIGFEMLTGRPPFRGETIPQLIYQHLEERPDAEALERSGADAVTRDLVARCLAKRPDARPQDARAVRTALSPVGSLAGPSSRIASDAVRSWVWAIGTCAWPPALLRFLSPFHAQVTAEAAGTASARSVIETLLYASIYPFTVLALLFTLVALLGARRAWRALAAANEPAVKRLRQLLRGPLGAIERIMLALLFGMTFGLGAIVLPSFRMMADAVGADYPALLRILGAYSEQYLLLTVIGLVGAATIERIRTRDFRATRVAVRGIALMLSLLLWLAAVSGL